MNAIAIGLGLENIEYEPEQSPGLVYRLEDPKVVALLFGSGKLVITGGKRLEDAEEDLTRIEDHDPGDDPSVLRITPDSEKEHRQGALDRLDRWGSIRRFR